MQNTRPFPTLHAFVIAFSIATSALPSLAKDLTPREVSLLDRSEIVTFVVDKTTWKGIGRPYDIGFAVAKKLENMKFKLTTEKQENLDATLYVDYREGKGIMVFGQDRIPGISIRCSVKLVHKTLGPVFEEVIRGNSGGITGFVTLRKGEDTQQVLYDDAVRYFEDHPIFKYLDKIVLANMGHGDRTLVLISAFTDDASWHTQFRAVQLLAQTGDKRAIEPLLSALIEPKDPKRSRGNQQYFIIQKALRKLGWRPKDASETIRVYLYNYHAYRSSASEINKLGRQAVPLLLVFLEDKNNYWILRMNAAQALGEIADPKAIPALTKVSKTDPEEQVRNAASEAIINIQTAKH